MNSQQYYLPAAQPVVTTPYIPRYVNINQLSGRCSQPILSFQGLGTTVRKTPDGILIHKDNGANILAVAHLDTVEEAIRSRVEGDKFFSPTLDDRLGAYLILDLLPHLLGNTPYDVLLTEGEEKGKSTAKYFKTHKAYNWMFEIDRMGTTSVMYQYETPEYRKLVTDSGLTVAFGSNTDIRYLEHLGVFGVNFGCSYYNNHSVNAYCILPELEAQIDKIVDFISRHVDTYMPHVKKVAEARSYYGGYGGYDYKQQAPSNPQHQKQTEFKTYYAKDHNKKRCAICSSYSCSGLQKCDCCGLSMHRDPFVELFNVCRDCLMSHYVVDYGDIDVIEMSKNAQEIRNSMDAIDDILLMALEDKKIRTEVRNVH